MNTDFGGGRAASGLRVLVCGSRSWSDVDVIDTRMAALPMRSEVLHGAAQGADLIAARRAFLCGHDVRAFPADWSTGRGAGLRRNLAMLDEKPDLVIAFWDGESRGTKFTIDEAKRRGIEVEVVTTGDCEAVASQRTRP